MLVRRRFSSIDELKSAVYASLVRYLEEKEIIRLGPFDATAHSTATLNDLDQDKIIDFVHVARSRRGFPLPESTPVEDVLIHLNLINGYRISNAAILLFGKEPQRFFINSEIRCVHFHGTIVAKPIPSYKVFKGDVFELVDQAVDFVLSKLDYSLGTRARETSIPGKYEIPREIVVEAIVNSIAHRDYTSNGSVQVMLFRDRLEVINPGALPMGWTTDKLRTVHASVPFNPLLTDPMYLKGYIERIGTGTSDMVRIAREAGLRDLEFIQDEMFRMVIYRPDVITGEAVDGAIDGVIDGAIDGVTNETKKKLVILLMAIIKDEGKRTPVYMEATKLGSERTVERYMRKLKDANLIEYKGDAAQTGGYYLTEQMKRKLK